MFVIIWEYEVRPEHLRKFRKIYASDGPWAKLFDKSDGYLGTELFRAETDSHRFLTIDRWESADAFNEFKANWQTEYDALDAQCKGMTGQETLIGRYILVI